MFSDEKKQRNMEIQEQLAAMFYRDSDEDLLDDFIVECNDCTIEEIQSWCYQPSDQVEENILGMQSGDTILHLFYQCFPTDPLFSEGKILEDYSQLEDDVFLKKLSCLILKTNDNNLWPGVKEDKLRLGLILRIASNRINDDIAADNVKDITANIKCWIEEFYTDQESIQFLNNIEIFSLFKKSPGILECFSKRFDKKEAFFGALNALDYSRLNDKKTQK